MKMGDGVIGFVPFKLFKNIDERYILCYYSGALLYMIRTEIRRNTHVDLPSRSFSGPKAHCA